METKMYLVALVFDEDDRNYQDNFDWLNITKNKHYATPFKPVEGDILYYNDGIYKVMDVYHVIKDGEVAGFHAMVSEY